MFTILENVRKVRLALNGNIISPLRDRDGGMWDLAGGEEVEELYTQGILRKRY